MNWLCPRCGRSNGPAILVCSCSPPMRYSDSTNVFNPVFNQDVDSWLSRAFGDKAEYVRLWLAAIGPNTT